MAKECLTTETMWTIEPPRFGAFNLQMSCQEIAERYNQLERSMRPTEIHVCTTGGLGLSVADRLRVAGLPVKEYFVTSSQGKVFQAR